jgi:hypothetical protein
MGVFGGVDEKEWVIKKRWIDEGKKLIQKQRPILL